MVGRSGIVWLLGMLAASCYYDNEAKLYPGTYCTPVVNPTFNTDVLPLLNAKCNSCHAGASPSGGIKLDSFAEVSKYVSNGKLLGSIKQTSGFSAMPKNAGKMPACQISVIEDWINAGGTNN